jgi:hypothetical protein
MEALIQKRNAAREKHNKLKKEILSLIGKKTGIEFELEALLNAAYDWGLFDGAITTGRGEAVI